MAEYEDNDEAKDPDEDRGAKGITDEQLCVLIESHETNAAISNINVQDQREAIQYYLGEPFGDEQEGRSQIVSREVADTIEWIKPSLMRIFASGDEVVKFDPHGPEDIEQAEQESDVLNWYTLQRNNAFTVLYSWFTDALLLRNGYVCAYWDESTDTSTEEYERLTAEEFALLQQDDEIEIVEQEESVEPELTQRQDPMTGEMVTVEIPVVYYEATVKRAKKRGSLRYHCIPPERAIIDGAHQEVGLDECDFAGYWDRLSITKLRSQFPDADIPDDINDESSAMQNQADTMSARDKLINWHEARDAGHVDPSLRLVRVVYGFVRADVDGDGLAERRYVVKCGKTILYNEATDIVQMAALTPIIFPHRHVGVSMFDLLKDLQEIKSMMLRGLIDSVYLANNGRTAVNADRVVLEDLLVSRPGGIIRTNGDPGGAIMPIQHPYIGGQVVNTLEYLDSVGEKRTGVTKYSQGLDANTLNKTATGISLITQAASQRIELIARVFAETGVRSLFHIAHALLRKHGDKQTVVKLRNKWVPINPRSWVQRYDSSVAVGLGTGDKQQQAQSLQMISMLQDKAIAQGSGLVSVDNLWNLAKQVVQTGGWKDVGSFFTDPSQRQPQQGQPPVDTKQPFAPPQQADPQAQEKQMRLQLDQMKMQQDQQRAEAELMLKKYEIDKQAEIEMMQRQIDADKEVRKLEMQNHYKMLADQLTQHASAVDGIAVQTATENARVPVVEAAQQALMPVVQQVGALANAAQQRNRPKAFRIQRQPDGSKVIHEIQ